MSLRLLSLLPALTGLALAQQQRVTETVYPADTPVQVGDARWHACRVVDAVTGAPIAGAELSLIEERISPLARQFWSKRVATSEADGFLRVRSDDLKGGFDLLLLRAPGYGPSAVTGTVPNLVWPLSPGIDVPIEVRDWQDRPVTDARMALSLGSGNTPDVAEATTDSNGAALFRGIDPNNPVADIYPDSPTLALSDYGRLDWVVGDHPVVINVAQGHRIDGKLLDHEGKPKAGVYIGAPQVARGPWTKTGDDGSFVLHGCIADPMFTVRVGRQLIHFERPDGEPPFTLKLPELPAAANEPLVDEPEDTPEGEEPTPTRRRPPPPILVEREALPEGPLVAIDLHVTDPDGKPIEMLEVTLRGPLPRYRVIAEDVRDGVMSTSRLPGKYLVTTESPRYEPTLGTIEVPEGERAQLKLVARPLAELKVRAEDRESLGSISVRTAAGSRDVTGEFGEDGLATIHVPNEEPFCIVVGNDIGVRVMRMTFGEAKANQPVVLQGMGRTKVTGTVVGPDGKPVPADVTVIGRHEGLRGDAGLDARQLEVQPADGGKFEAAVVHEGLAFVVAVPRDLKLRPGVFPVTLPRRGVAVTADVGNLKLIAAPQLVVRAADGSTKGDTTAELVRVGWHDVRRCGPKFPLDAQGGWLGPALRAGDAVVVPAEQWDIEREVGDDEELIVDLPFRTVLQGDGPWNVQVPPGVVSIAMKDKSGSPVVGRVFIADRSVSVPGKLRLQQVPLGKHEIVLVARDRKAVLATIEVKADAPTELVVEMPAQ